MREKKLSIRLGDKLYAELAKKAEKYNQSISEYVRGVLIKEMATARAEKLGLNLSEYIRSVVTKDVEEEENWIKNIFGFLNLPIMSIGMKSLPERRLQEYPKNGMFKSPLQAKPETRGMG